MENSKRTIEHRKNESLEIILTELESLIGGVCNDKQFISEYPVVFVMGCARSGTTLLTQLLATVTNWCYPSNLISRFYYAPYIGALLQKMLFDLDEKSELFGKYKNEIKLSSRLGKTIGALSPHEFWYYWRRFFQFGDIHQLSTDELKNVDGEGFVNGLKAIQAVFEAPLFMKGMIMNWHIPFLAELIPNSYFIHVIRDIRFNAQSLLKARKDFFGDTKEWYSFKPPEYNQLMHLRPEEQVVHQVHFTNIGIEKGLSQLTEERVFKVKYELLCDQPGDVLFDILKRLDSTNVEQDLHLKQMESTNRVSIPPEQWQIIEQTTKQLNGYK